MLALQFNISFGATTNFGRSREVIAQPNTQGNKNSRPPVMHPAFQNAGKVAGLEIWRVEVSKIVFISVENLINHSINVDEKKNQKEFFYKFFNTKCKFIG